MADSIEQKIMTAVVARMATILTTNGYVTNIGTHCEDSRTNWDQSELPAMSVFQGETTPVPEDDERQLVTRTMQVLIKVFAEQLDTAALTAALMRNVIKDVYQAIRTDLFWTVLTVKLALDTEEGTHGIEYQENSFEVIGAQVAITIQYRSHLFNLES